MKRALHRAVAWALVVILATGPLAPVLKAQGVALAPGSPEYNAYVTEVRDRLAHREGLESMYQRQAQRQAQMQAELQALQGMRPPADVDPTQWQARMQQDQSQLQTQITQNQQLLNRTQGHLQPLYRKLQDDQERIKRSGNSDLQTQIGVLIGAAGAHVVPIWSRMTGADYAGMAKYGAQQAHLRTVNWRIPKYQNIATNAGARAANAESALGSLPTVQWKPQPNSAGTNMQLVAHDGALGTPIEGVAPVETPVPAKITNANGQVVDNPNAVRAASDFAQLHNTRSQLEFQISSAKLKASRAINSAQKEIFERHASNLETKKAQLDADITKYQSENPSVGSRMQGLAKDAGKWALMSVGITATANVVSQLAQNGWNPSKVNYGQAMSFLVDRHFWGGTAGSFVGSMAGTAIASAIPGGVFVKALLSIGGASAGWAIGSGNAGKTDWIGLGVTTVGSTAGFMLGMAIGGPIGAFLGGIVGQLASQFIYDKLKDWLIREEAATSTGAAGIPVVQAGVDPNQNPGYQGPPPTSTGYGAQQPPPPPPLGADGVPVLPPARPADSGPGTLVDATARMNQAYNDAQAALQAGDQQLHMLKMQEYQDIRAWIQRKRQEAGAAGPADERSNDR